MVTDPDTFLAMDGGDDEFDAFATTHDDPSLRAASAADGADDLAPGDKLGRYRLEGRIGAGAMGVVWRARDPKLDREVAIKVVHPALARLPDAPQRLLREARALAKVSHAAVVAVHDAGQDGARLFVAMELVAGTTLGAMLRARGGAELRDWQRWWRLLVMAGRGLAAAHAAGVLHRDFKPENVLVAANGRVAVADFGLAEIAAGLDTAPRRPSVADAGDSWQVSADSLTVTGAVVGTPAYMSPEQLRSGVVDARSDQFGFCVAAFEALYGYRPFAYRPVAGQPAAQALLAEIEADRILAPPRDTAVPRWLRDAIERGLAADPARRWPDMRALLAAMQPPRRTWLVLAAIAAAAIVIGFLTFTAVRPTPPAPARHRLFPVPMWSGARSSPDGTRVAYVDHMWIHVRPLDRRRGPPPAQLLTGAAIDRVVFERDDRIAFSTFERTGLRVRRWDLATGAVSDVAELAGWANWYGVTRHGELRGRTREDRQELVLIAPSPAGEVVLASAERHLASVEVAPGERWVAYVDDRQFHSELVVVDLGERRELTRTALTDLSAAGWIGPDRLLYATGASLHPTLWAATVTPAGLGAPTRVWGADVGWFGNLTVVGDKIRLVDTETSFVVRWVDRDAPAMSRELDPGSVAASLGWDGAGHPLGWHRASGRIVRFVMLPDRVDVSPTPALLDADIGNATRADDIAIVSVRRAGGREIVALSLASGARLWSRPAGQAVLVRCAGDAREPCVEVAQPPEGDATMHLVDPRTGARGVALPAPATVADVAVSADGAELMISDGFDGLYRLALVGGALALAPGPAVSLNTVRGVVHDPRGGLLLAGSRSTRLYQVIRIAPDGREEVVSQSPTDLMSVPRPAPDGAKLLVLTRRYLPMLVEVTNALP